MELYKLSATDALTALKKKEITSVELTSSVFSRIKDVEDKVNAYISLSEEHALKLAADADEKIARGENLPPLCGVPIAIKDNICTKGVLTTCASKMLSNFIPPYDATVTQKIKEAGAVLIGKTNLDEFAMGSSCENSAIKKTKNPHDLSRVPGGSSGGSAAAVAADETILALGSDTGGSIRQPSAYCGIVGLKPTYGAVSRYGLVAFASSLDQIGPMTKTVADASLLYDVIAGRDENDATSRQCSVKNTFANLKKGVKGMKIGLPKEFFGDGIEESVKKSVMEGARALEKDGAILKEISLSLSKYALSTYYIVSSAEASSNLARFDGIKYGYRTEEFSNLEELYEKTRSEGFGDEVKRRILLGTYVLSSGYYDAYYKKGQIARKLISKEYESVLSDVDVILTPTVPTTAFKIGGIQDPVTMYLNDICTVSINIASLPAISVPCGADENNLPIGMQLIGKRFSEQTLLNSAYTFENLVGREFQKASI